MGRICQINNRENTSEIPLDNIIVFFYISGKVNKVHRGERYNERAGASERGTVNGCEIVCKATVHAWPMYKGKWK